MHPFPLAIQLDYVTVLRYLRPPEPSAATLWWMLAAVLGAGLVFALFEFISRRIRRNRAMKKSRDDFNHLTLVCQLMPEEIKLLRTLVDACTIKYPDRLFTSFELFNRCMEDSGPAASGLLSESAVKSLRIIRNKIFFGERSKAPPIKTTHDLKTNQWLHLKRIANGQVFMAPVVEAGASGLLVATPRIKGEYLKMKPGERFDIYFWRDRDASYHFESEVVGQSGTHYLITIFKHVEDVERIQRRQYHRVDVSVPVLVTPVTRSELEKVDGKGIAAETEHPGLRAHVINMSGAGFALASRVELKPNDFVYLELPTGEDNFRMPLLGKILNVTKKELTEEFLLHAEFVGLSADAHERIFRFIYSHARPETLPAA